MHSDDPTLAAFWQRLAVYSIAKVRESYHLLLERPREAAESIACFPRWSYTGGANGLGAASLHCLKNPEHSLTFACFANSALRPLRILLGNAVIRQPFRADKEQPSSVAV